VWGTGTELVVVKPGVNGGRRCQSAWRQFLDNEGDGRLTDGSSQISSRWLSGVGSQNGGGGVKGVLERRRTAKEMTAKGSRRR
jgi:hypothetical protein